MISVVSYPERGEGGQNTYRGNCSPKLIEDLVHQYHIKEISDYMCGSGTTEDVAKKLGIPSYCYDLNRGFDLLNDEIKERPSYIFWHPPYGTMVRYAGEQYDANEVIQKYGFDPRERDLSRPQSWEDFIKELNACMMKQFAALEKGGYIAALMGDMKKNRRLYSMILDIAKPGTIEQIVIKMQYNCMSDKVKYSGKPFIYLVHEYLLILRKDDPLLFNIKMTRDVPCDLRDLNLPTWRDIVAAVLEQNGRRATLEELYSAIDGHKRTLKNSAWKEKIRQTLQLSDQFRHVERGVWELAA